MISIRVDGINSYLINLSRAIDVFDDYDEWFKELAFEVLVDEIENIFESDGFGRWPERKDNKPHDLLRLSFALYDSLTQPFGPGNVIELNGNTFEYGSDIFYHDFHEFDDVAPNIPARPVLGFLLQAEFEERVARHLDDWIQQRIRQLGID